MFTKFKEIRPSNKKPMDEAKITMACDIKPSLIMVQYSSFISTLNYIFRENQCIKTTKTQE